MVEEKKKQTPLGDVLFGTRLSIPRNHGVVEAIVSQALVGVDTCIAK